MKNILLLTLLLLPSLAPAQSALPHNPSVWMHPSNLNNGQPFRDLFAHPDAWAQARSKIDVLCNTDLNLQHKFSDDELRNDFMMLKAWQLRLALEVGAIKPWGKTGEKVFSIELPMWQRINRLGGNIYAIAMDEPLCCCRKEINEPDDYAVRETANYIALVRQNFPDMLIGDIEPYPFISLADQIQWIDALQSRLKEMNVRGLDFYRLDVNWAEFTVFDHGSWPEVKRLEQACHQRKLPFSLIYWPSPYPEFAKRKIADDSTWYTLLMAQGYDYALINGHPDQIVLESWLDAPAATIPETDSWTFTRLRAGFLQSFRQTQRRFRNHKAIPMTNARATLARWLVPDGDFVEQDQPICELETDNASADICATHSGILRHLAQPGDPIAAQTEFARIDPVPDEMA